MVTRRAGSRSARVHPACWRQKCSFTALTQARLRAINVLPACGLMADGTGIQADAAGGIALGARSDKPGVQLAGVLGGAPGGLLNSQARRRKRAGRQISVK